MATPRGLDRHRRGLLGSLLVREGRLAAGSRGDSLLTVFLYRLFLRTSIASAAGIPSRCEAILRNRDTAILRYHSLAVSRCASSSSPDTPPRLGERSIADRIRARIRAERVTLRQPARLMSRH